MSISLERRLLSAQLRLLTEEPWPEAAVPTNRQLVLEIVAAMTGGDIAAAALALGRFCEQLAKEDPVANAVLDLFFMGQLDLVGVDNGPNGPDLKWAATPTGEEARH